MSTKYKHLFSPIKVGNTEVPNRIAMMPMGVFSPRLMNQKTGAYTKAVSYTHLIGSFVDSYFEGTLSEFIENHPAIFTRKNELRSEFRKANEIITRVKACLLYTSC